MANDVKKQADMIARESIMILENELVMANKVHRAHESEFSQKPNGFKKGNNIIIKKPADFTVRDGATASAQDVEEGSTNLTVDKRKGIDFKFSSQELTLDINSLKERVIRPAMIQLANQVDVDLQALYKDVPNLVGTPGQTIDSYQDFIKGPERLNEFGVPLDDRCGTLAPSDHAGLLGSQTTLYDSTIVKPAYRKADTGMVGGVDLYMTQNTPTHTVGNHGGTPLVNGANQNVAYSAVKDTNQQTLNTDGWPNSRTGVLKAGDVFTIAGVFAVNPVTKATLPFLRQFTVVADADSGASTGPAALTISPAIITSGAHKTVSAVPADNAAITVVSGTAEAGYRQNMVFHKNAFALAMVPLEIPPSKKPVSSRQSYKGLSVRVIPYYDGLNDVENWRLDILYGVKAIDPRLATRLHGTA